MNDLNFENLKYFIKENYLYDSKLPSMFNTENLSNNLNELCKKLDIKNKIEYKPVKILIPKKNSREKREITIPHPRDYINLSKIIIENWNEIEKHLSKSNISITKIKNISKRKNKIKLISSKENFDDLIIKFSARNKFLLKTDISKFYSSIYTHSITWAIHDKEKIKEKINLRKKINCLLGDKIDIFTRKLSENQTNGILTGIFTSEIISEIVLSQIDFELNEKSKLFEGFRYVDDYYLFFRNKNDSEELFSLLEDLLNKYELGVNFEKTKILEIPIELDDSWKIKINKIEMNQPLSENKEKIEIKNYFNEIFELVKNNPDDSVLIYGIKKISNINFNKKNWYLVESFLLQSINLDSRALPEIVEFLIKKNYSYYYTLNIENISRALNNNLNHYISKNLNFEIIWTLFLIYNLDIKIEKSLINDLIGKNRNQIILIMILHLKDKKLFEIKNTIFEKKYLTNLFFKNRNLRDDWLLLNEIQNGNLLDLDLKEIINECEFSKTLNSRKINLVDLDFFKNNFIKEITSLKDEDLDIEEISIENFY